MWDTYRRAQIQHTHMHVFTAHIVVYYTHARQRSTLPLVACAGFILCKLALQPRAQNLFRTSFPSSSSSFPPTSLISWSIAHNAHIACVRARAVHGTQSTHCARTYTHKDLDGIRQIEKVRIPLHRIPRGRLQFYHVGVYHVGEGHFRCGCMDSTKFGFSAHTHTHTHTRIRAHAHTLKNTKSHERNKLTPTG